MHVDPRLLPDGAIPEDPSLAKQTEPPLVFLAGSHEEGTWDERITWNLPATQLPNGTYILKPWPPTEESVDASDLP